MLLKGKMTIWGAGNHVVSEHATSVHNELSVQLCGQGTRTYCHYLVREASLGSPFPRGVHLEWSLNTPQHLLVDPEKVKYNSINVNWSPSKARRIHGTCKVQPCLLWKGRGKVFPNSNMTTRLFLGQLKSQEWEEKETQIKYLSLNGWTNEGFYYTLYFWNFLQ